jgi:cyclohexanecarboxylate-CoA ligase
MTADLKASGLWLDEILDDWVERHATERPDKLAVINGDTRLTFAELRSQTQRLARGLANLGIVKGDVVAVQLPNVPEFLLCFLALSRIGAVMQTVHMPYREAELEGLLSHSGACAVIC